MDHFHFLSIESELTCNGDSLVETLLQEIISFEFQKNPALATVASLFKSSSENMKIVYWSYEDKEHLSRKGSWNKRRNWGLGLAMNFSEIIAFLKGISLELVTVEKYAFIYFSQACSSTVAFISFNPSAGMACNLCLACHV